MRRITSTYWVVAVCLLAATWATAQPARPARPVAGAQKQLNLSGLWLTDLGLMELEQEGDKVSGRYAIKGTSDIEGKLSGRKFEFTYKSFRDGRGSFEISADGNSFTGTATSDGGGEPYNWKGRRAPEYVRHNKLVAGKMVEGSTKGLLTYTVRAPAGYKAGDAKKWPTILILHGSNMNAKAYVNTLASAWPDIARDYLIIGINGERPADVGGAGKEAVFNYTYVSYVGKSTFKGYPGTDRESPGLVSEAMSELREVYPIAKYFVGGHSQGGFLTYSLLMNFPEMIAGAFPISGGVIFQCEPAAYADEKVMSAQRMVPLAIIHGKNDPVVAFSMSEYASVIFGEASWPALRLFDDATAAHMFGRLPVRDAIRWLEAHSSDDPAKLLDFAEKRFREKGYRDAVAAVNRARTLGVEGTLKDRLERVTTQIDARAKPAAEKLLPKIRENKDSKWIDEFLTFRDDFEFAPASAEVMKAFNDLRAQHEDPAKKLMNEARAAFQQNRRDEGYAKYQEIVEKHYAAPQYRNAKKWLAERK